MNENEKEIIESVGRAALYEQLAEEAVELAKEAIKMGRVIRAENPTPVTEEVALKRLTEEYTDVKVVADILGREPDTNLYTDKNRRWIDRIMNNKKEEK